MCGAVIGNTFLKRVFQGSQKGGTVGRRLFWSIIWWPHVSKDFPLSNPGGHLVSAYTLIVVIITAVSEKLFARCSVTIQVTPLLRVCAGYTGHSLGACKLSSSHSCEPHCQVSLASRNAQRPLTWFIVIQWRLRQPESVVKHRLCPCR